MDLNLVRVFVAIHETQSLTLAAQRLHVTQPAVSQALGRLRRGLDDPLFEREGRRMRPTPAADDLFPVFRDALAALDRAVDDVRGFDPARSEHRFRIAMSELGEIAWAPGIVRRIRERAPRASVEIVPIDVRELPEWLGRGTVDLAITPSPVPGGFAHSIVKSQEYAVVMSRQHPLASGPLRLEDYVAADHAAVSGDSGLPSLLRAQSLAGATIRPRATVARFASLPAVLAADSSLVATVPASIALSWARSQPLATVPLPFPMDPVAVRLYRRSTTERLAALEWFRDAVERAVRTGDPWG